jgi:hypothetical protein
MKNYMQLILWLMDQEKFPDEKFKPFVDMLPTDLSAFAPFYGEKEWEILEGTWIGSHLKECCENLDNNYRMTQKLAPEIFDHSAEAFKKAFLIY